jgi:TonB family protein
MKRYLLPLIPFAFLLGACSSTLPTPAGKLAAVPTGPAVRIENRLTAWGEMPSYEPKGHFFQGLRAPGGGASSLTGEVTLDFLINPDGTIQDSAIFSSSGQPKLDRAALARFKHARYTLRLGPDDPAPHVVRLTVGFKAEPDRGREPIPKGFQDYKGAGPQPVH